MNPSAADSPANQSQLGRQLQSGLQDMGLDLPQTAQQKLLDFLDLLQKWNRAFNLSAVRQESQLVSRHLLDSLSLLPLIAEEPARHQRIIDVGTGPGLPGIPLAICLPHCDFILLDSNGKKTRFAFQAKIALGLSNVSVENCRVEHYQSPAQIDIVISRAFSSLRDMVEKTVHLQAKATASPMRWLAMKGVYPAGEIEELPAFAQLRQALQVHIPGDPGERHIVEMLARHPGPEQ